MITVPHSFFPLISVNYYDFLEMIVDQFHIAFSSFQLRIILARECSLARYLTPKRGKTEQGFPPINIQIECNNLSHNLNHVFQFHFLQSLLPQTNCFIQLFFLTLSNHLSPSLTHFSISNLHYVNQFILFYFFNNKNKQELEKKDHAIFSLTN